MLETRGLTLKRGRKVVVPKLSVSFSRGVTAVLGPNGAGKSTLLEALATGRRPAGGEICLDGDSLDYSAVNVRNFLATVGYMPQSWSYFRAFTALESVEYVAWLKRVPRKVRRDAAEAALSEVALDQFLNRKVASFSGGMKQRVGLAEALVNRPSVVLLDEPTVGLDPAQRAEFRTAIRGGALDRIVVLSTHLTDDVEAMADRVLVLADGRIRFDGTPDELRGRASGITGAASSLEDGYLSLLASPGVAAS